MRRYWVEPGQINKNSVQISGELFHHICGVCRQKLGDQFEILSYDGQALLVELQEVEQRSAVAKIIGERKIYPLPRPHIHLAVSLPRFSKWDLILEKSVELGVKQVHPFISENSFVQSEKKVSPNKLQRWSKIIRSATQQCGRGELMELGQIKTLRELMGEFNRRSGARGLFPYEGERISLGFKEALQGLHEPEPDEIWVFIGSEGGYTTDEVEWVRKNGIEPMTLGTQILRVETACVAVTSIIKYEFGHMEV